MVMDMNNVYMGKILIVDLDQGTCIEEVLPEELVEERIGGIGINVTLYKRFEDREPIVVGTGMLTGTFAPASSSAAITAKSPRSGRVCHVPLTWQTAVELKYSGYDFMVFLGASARPVRLWLHDEIAELADASAFWGKDVWETTDGLRVEHGDDYVQVLSIGPAGEKGHAIGQVSENYWGSKDVVGFGGLFGRKRLKAVAMRGLGSLGVAEGFFSACVDFKEKIKAAEIGPYPQGVCSILEALGLEPLYVEAMKKQVHRSVASFNGFYPSNSFLMIDQDPGLLQESELEEPGVLVTDIAAAASLAFLKEAMAGVIRRANRLGLDPVACGRILAARGITDSRQADAYLKKIAEQGSGLIEEGLEHIHGIALWPLSDSTEVRLVQALSLLSHTVPPSPVFHDYEVFGVSGDPIERARWWIQVQAAALIMGFCPLAVLLSPEFTLDRMASLGAVACGSETLDAAQLGDVARSSLTETMGLSAQGWEIPASWKADGFDESALKVLLNV